MFFAILHEKSRLKQLFLEPNLDAALNCGRASEFSPRVIKATVDSDPDYPTLRKRVIQNFAPYLSRTEWIKIYSKEGTELFRFNGGFHVSSIV